jgi:hypothetical protein
MPAGRPQGPNDPSLLSGLEAALRPPRRPGLVEASWNWRRELGILAALGAAAGFIANAAGPVGLAVTTGAGLAAGAAVLLCLPSARRWLVTWAWCLVTPHRIRVGCRSGWVQTRDGRLPFILSTSPASYGERVKVWLLPGLTAADLDAAAGTLAAACWAAEVRVVPGVRYAHLVTLEVVRKRQPERAQPTLATWPEPRQLPGDGLGGIEDRDTWRQPGETVPPPRLSPEQDWPGRYGRSYAPVPYDH